MKLFTKIFVFGLLILLPFGVSAATFSAAEELTLRENITEDVYFAGANAFISGDVSGDILGAGGNVTVSGNADTDLMIVGGTIQTSGEVGDDLRIAGGNLTIGNSVKGDALVAGGRVFISPDMDIKGDAFFAGGQVIVNGNIGGDLEAYGGEIRIEGTILGNVKIWGEKVVIGKNAKISGNLSYKSPKEATIEEGSLVVGSVNYETIQKGDYAEKGKSVLGWIFGVGFFVKLLMVLATALVFLFVFKNLTKEYVETGLGSFWKEAGIGFLVLVATPIAAIILLITVLGIPFAILGILSYVIMIVVAKIFAGILLGSYVFKTLGKKSSYEVNWKTVVVGIILAILIALIPFIGWIVVGFFFLASLGAVASHWHKICWLKR